jgi:hypothetical protein
MARIRTVKPETFEHEVLFDAEKETGLPLRVAWIGLWTQCDRRGRFLWRPRQLKANILPYDDLDFERVLDALWTHGFLVKYASDGNTYGCIPTWDKHQFINNKEKESELPEPTTETLVLIEKSNASVTREGRVLHAPFPFPSLSPSCDSQSLQKEVVSGRQTPTTILKTILDDERASAVVDHRKRIGAALGNRAAKMLVESLSRFPDPNAAADTMMERGWRTIKPGWGEDRSHGPPAKEKHFRGVVQEFLDEVDEKHGNGRRAICSQGGVGNIIELHAAAARLENHAGAVDAGSGGTPEIDTVEHGRSANRRGRDE